jgi:hypothetical protein
MNVYGSLGSSAVPSSLHAEFAGWYCNFQHVITETILECLPLHTSGVCVVHQVL